MIGPEYHSPSLDLLVDYASQMHLKNAPNIVTKMEEVTESEPATLLTEDSTEVEIFDPLIDRPTYRPSTVTAVHTETYSLDSKREYDGYQGIQSLIQSVSGQKDRLSPMQRAEFKASLDHITKQLAKKLSGIRSWFVSKKEKADIHSTLLEIGSAEKTLGEVQKDIKTEKIARMQFYHDLKKHKLSITDAADEQEQSAIKEISERVWKYCEEARKKDEYGTIMAKAFNGVMLIEEEEEISEDLDDMSQEYAEPQTYTQLQTATKVESHVKLYEEETDPSYAIQGPQVKTLQFGRVKLLANDNGPILGKSQEEAQQVDAKTKTYTYVKMAPSLSWWKRGAFSFVSAVRKMFRMENSNVGPYRYSKDKPTILELHPLTEQQKRARETTIQMKTIEL